MPTRSPVSKSEVNVRMNPPEEPEVMTTRFGSRSTLYHSPYIRAIRWRSAGSPNATV